MSTLPTFLKERLQTSIKFNGVFYPANYVMKAAHSCVAPALFGNANYPDFPVSFLGSLLKLKYQQRYFCLLTRHQCDQHDVEWLLLEQCVNHKWVSGHQVISSGAEKNDPEWIDLCLIEFTELVEQHLISPFGWLNLRTRYRWDHIYGCFSLGYPFFLNDIYTDPEKFDFQCTVLDGKPPQKELKSLWSFEFDTPLDYEPNGISGGPVFLLIENDDELELIPAGITVMANKRLINFIPPDQIKEFINKLLED